MKFLVDNALPPIVAELLAESGHEAAHVRDFEMQSASDEEIFNFAAQEGYVIISADTDFGALLALRQSRKPSFVLFRRLVVFQGPQSYATALVLNLSKIADDLRRGAVVTFDGDRVRIRPLPIGGSE
ncbi:MAG: DUF5615 family PIN-like protein [Candidatus Kapaibacterium sp.]